MHLFYHYCITTDVWGGGAGGGVYSGYPGNVYLIFTKYITKYTKYIIWAISGWCHGPLRS